MLSRVRARVFKKDGGVSPYGVDGVSTSGVDHVYPRAARPVSTMVRRGRETYARGRGSGHARTRIEDTR